MVGALFLGKVQDYLSKLGVATLVLEAPLSVGDGVRIKGHTTDLTQKVDHIEVDHKSVPSAAPGEGVGVKVADRVRIGDAVYKI
ncbi:MAG: translation elongation factor-like protein [Elusimicrobia bacterium]|nr:translation elongation factor-like protein [Elusimicrobiota bacterium]